MSHDMQWIHKGSSCILLSSSMSKVSCLKIHNDRKEILSSFVTKEKIIFNRRPPPKKRYPSDQVKRQIKYQCWHGDKHTRPWGSIFIFPWGIYEAAVFLIPVLIKCVTCPYELFCNYLWLRLLHPNSTDNSGAQRDRELRSQISLPT